MKNLRSLTSHLLCLFFLLTLASIALGAEPVVPERTLNMQRNVFTDQKPGSVLIFNLYTSSATDAGKADTDLSLTNVNAAQPAFVHVYFVAGGGSVADAYLCLTPNQTVSFLASDVDPGVTGYIVAHATDRNGCPLSFNYLIGSEYTKMASGHAANLPAESYAALFNGTVPGCSSTSTSAVLALNGVMYNAAPSMLGVDKIPSPNDGNSTMLILNRLEGNLAIGVTPNKVISGVLYDDVENAFRFSFSTTRNLPPQVKMLLGDDFPQTTPKFSQVIKSGTTGWMRVMADDDRAVSGAVINFNPNAATGKRAFSGGHNLHHLRFTSTSFTTAVFEPTC